MAKTKGYKAIKKKLAENLTDKGIMVYALADEDSYTIFVEADTDKTSADDVRKILLKENIVLRKQPSKGIFATTQILSNGYYCEIANKV